MTDIVLDTYTTFSLKFREENEAGLMFWTGPGVALEISRL